MNLNLYTSEHNKFMNHKHTLLNHKYTWTVQGYLRESRSVVTIRDTIIYTWSSYLRLITTNKDIDPKGKLLVYILAKVMYC